MEVGQVLPVQYVFPDSLQRCMDEPVVAGNVAQVQMVGIEFPGVRLIGTHQSILAMPSRA